MGKVLRRWWPLFVLPCTLSFVFGFIIPFVQGAYLSFCEFKVINKAKFVGLSNYVAAFQDEQFAHAF
jgi:raffinose/stachyose/melibiose transport system permease protein